MPIELGTPKMDRNSQSSTSFDFWATYMLQFQPTEMTDHTNACSRIQNFANNSKIENSRNKDQEKIFESTVHHVVAKPRHHFVY